MGKLEIIIIIVLALVVGLLIAKLNDKRNTNIIKLLIKRDLLPEAGAGTKWIQNAVCYMGDKSLGKVNGLYCEQVQVL